MAGILKRLSIDLPIKYLCNLPETELDEALLWQPRGEAVKRDLEAGEHIPSWSWTGWEGGVTYGVTEISMATNKSILWPLKSEIRWLVEDNASMAEIEIGSQDLRLHRNQWKADGWQHATTRGHKFLRHYYFHAQLPGHRFQHPFALTASQKPKVSLRRTSGALCFMARTVKMELIEDSTELIQKSEIISLFHSQTSGLGLADEAYGVHDTAGICIGSVKLMNRDRKYSNLQLIALSRCNTNNDVEHLSRFYDDPLESTPYFDSLAATEVPNGTPRIPIHPERADGQASSDETRYKNGVYCFYNAMAVDVVDGVAYRIGLGKVHVDGFGTAAPEWSRVELR